MEKVYSAEQLTDLFGKKMAGSQKNFHRPGLLICGLPGVGKTALLRMVFGDLIPSLSDSVCSETESPGNIFSKDVSAKMVPNGGECSENDRIITKSSSDQPDDHANLNDFDKYENENIIIWEYKGPRFGETETEYNERIERFVQEHRRVPRQDSSNKEDDEEKFDLVWYAIKGTNSRIEPGDLDRIDAVRDFVETITVITKRDQMRPARLISFKNDLDKWEINEKKIVAVTNAENGSIGAEELIRISAALLSDELRSSFLTAQSIDRSAAIQAIYDKSSAAHKIIAAAVTAAGGIGLIPIPLSDASLLIPTQIGMVAGLAALYRLQDRIGSSLVLPFIGECAGLVTATSLTKLIPGLGSLINAGVAGSITAAMGKFVQNSFEEIAVKIVKGEPVPEFGFSFDKFKAFYEKITKK